MTTNHHFSTNMDCGNGKVVDILQPDPSVIDIQNILESMENLNRFAGGGKGAVSVLRHSLHVASRMDTASGRKYGILHDAHETITGEITTPMKRAIGYSVVTKIQMGLDYVIFEAAGYEPRLEDLKYGKEADRKCMIIEKDWLDIAPGDDWGTGFTTTAAEFQRFQDIQDMPSFTAIDAAWEILNAVE